VLGALGAVRSIVIVVVAVATLVGPTSEALLVTELAASLGITVPSLHPEIVIIKLEPLVALGEKVQSVAVPAFEKSPETKPLIDSEKVTEKEMSLDVLVGEN
jgi:hypothetical protein